ncbi:MmyB family transcriptional regulator [Streptomyces smyrnaeus]|uniref:MmyB family transcriptional regulator n=1 Tax=Streptomyces smyrnaeus TaxID=1387713 RepID=UPI00378CA598
MSSRSDSAGSRPARPGRVCGPAPRRPPARHQQWQGCEEFARLWAEQDIKVNGRGHKVMRHPDAGVISVHVEVLVPLQDPDQRLMIFRGADDRSRSALERLSAQ